MVIDPGERRAGAPTERRDLAKKAAAIAASILLVGFVAWHWGFAPGEPTGAAPGASPPYAAAVEAREAAPKGPGLAEVPAATARARRAAPADEGPATGATFTGRVVDDATGRPIEGAQVVFANEFARGEGEPAAKSGADGAFLVLGVKSGDVDSCLVEAKGYAWAVVSLSEEAKGAAAEVTHDLGELKMIRGASVRGRVVASPGGVGVVGATLLLSDDAGSGFAPAFARDAGRTGDGGRFAIEHVPPTRRSPAWVLFAIAAEGIGWAALPATAGKQDVAEVEVAMRPTATLVVRAEDTAGKPVPGAGIRLEPSFEPLGSHGGHSMWLGQSPEVLSVLEAHADAEGVVRFDRLPVGDGGGATYDVVAYAKGFILSWRDGVKVQRGEEASATVVLQPYRAASMAGTVREKDGGPVAGAKVLVDGEARAVTGADGTFRLADLDPSDGTAYVGVEAAGYAPVRREVPLPKDADAADQTFRLVKAAPIEGRVVDQNGRPVPGVALQVQGAYDETLLSGVSTDADGRFRFPDAAAGTWTMQVFPPEPHEGWLEAGFDVPVKGGDRSVEVVLTRFAPGAARVHAVVVDAATGAPLTPTEGTMVPVGAPARGRSWNSPPVVADATGLSADGVKPGPWIFWARVPERPSAFVRIDVREGDTNLLARIEVGRVGALAGRVEFPDGRVVPHAAVFAQIRDADGRAPWAFAGSGRGFTRLAGDGTFRLEGLMPGTYRIRLIAHGLLREADVEVAGGAETQVVVKASAAGVLRFRSASPMPVAVTELYVAFGDGPMERVMRLGGIAGKPLDYQETVRPGRLRWRVRFEAVDGSELRDVGSALPVAADTAEGEVTVGAGETVEVIVPIVLR